MNKFSISVISILFCMLFVNYSVFSQRAPMKFGKVSDNSTCKFEDNQLTYIRCFKMQKGQHPAGEYDKLVTFFRDVYKADNSKMVLLKN